MKISIAAGGTGGHLFPALGFYENLKNSNKNIEVCFFVSTRDFQYYDKWDTKPYILKAIGFPRKVSLSLLKFMIYFVRNLFYSIYVIRSAKPDIVIGFGGYVSVAPLLAAVILGKPVAIHEQNIIPGKVNRVLARFASSVMLGLKGSEKYWPEHLQKKLVFTGIPVRDNAKPNKAFSIFEPDNSFFTVLIMGGSQGSLVFNNWIKQILPELKRYSPELRFIHLAGKHEVSEIENAYNEYGIKNTVFNFHEKMGEIYPSCDIAICRAGAGTLSELAYAELPAIVIPYPYATDNHQFHNASSFYAQGAVDLIEEKNCGPKVLAEKIIFYLNNRDKLNEMKRICGELAVKNAGDKMLEVITQNASFPE